MKTVKSFSVSGKTRHLTDTGEFAPKWTRVFSSLFPPRPSDEYDLAPSRKYSRPLWCKFTCGQVSSPRLYRLRQELIMGYICYLVQKLPELSCVSFWLLDESTFSVSSSLAAYYMVIRWKAVVDPIKTFYKSFSTYL